MKHRNSIAKGATIELVCALCILFAPSVSADSLYPQNNCIWSIPSGNFSIPNGYCVKEAILTIRNIAVLDSVSSRLSVYLMHDNAQGFYGVQTDIPTNIFSSDGLSLGEFDPTDVANGTLQIRLSQILNTLPNNHPLNISLPVQFSDGSTSVLSPAILQFMDYLGSSPSLALGFHSEGFSFDSLSLVITCRSFTGPAGGRTFFVSSGNLQPPVLEPVGDKTVFEGQEIQFALNAADSDDPSLSYYGINLPAGAVLSGNQFTWTPSWNQAGIYGLKFAVSDGKNIDSLDVYITVLDVNQPPKFAPVANPSGQERKLLTFSLVVDDPDGNPVTLSAQNLPSGAVFQSNTFSWIPGTGKAGKYEILFTASDGLLQTHQTVTIDIFPASSSYFLF
jgi:hypothetical protein